ncbi:MAG: hypothetical protein ACKPKO_12075, partial [Candidatus Fonsibacter sp.]
LPAGSKFANRFLKLLLLLPIDILLAKWAIKMTLYVDDFALRVAGTMNYVCRVLPGATSELVCMLERWLQLTVSRYHGVSKGKSAYVASSSQLADHLAERMAVLGIHRTDSERWLGVDYQPARGKSSKTRKKRFAKAKGRWLKAASLRRRGIKVGRFVRQGLRPSLAYGSSVEGTSGAVLRFLH